MEYTERQKEGKEISYSVVSNLTLLTDEMVRFFAKYKVSISTSLDGNQYLHNKNRPYPTGAGTYQDVLRGIDKLREAGICVGAIETTTRQSLSHLKEIIDTYCDLEFRSIFLRPLTPLGCANKEWTTIGYSTEEFTQFYSDAIAYILEKNRQGYALQEGHAAILFSKILHGYPVNYVEATDLHAALRLDRWHITLMVMSLPAMKDACCMRWAMILSGWAMFISMIIPHWYTLPPAVLFVLPASLSPSRPVVTAYINHIVVFVQS